MTKYIGHSNGKKYDVIKIDPAHPNIGLAKLPEYSIETWCSFDKIEKVNQLKLF